MCGYDSPIRGTHRYEDTTDSDVVVVTSGIARKPGMSRSELLETNTNIVRSVVQEVAARSPEAVLVRWRRNRQSSQDGECVLRTGGGRGRNGRGHYPG